MFYRKRVRFIGNYRELSEIADKIIIADKLADKFRYI
ncbi:MAG: hypothetical protein UW11_C0009G0015 [Parcubacteria group bacterium GW2011_GWA2_43_9b]|nr:MAG: hypothetical protein UW11_C0009G0015 [Parcubacteria group bacterium GW2011_GWA2_43_9b]